MTHPSPLHPAFCGQKAAGCPITGLPVPGAVHRSRPLLLNLTSALGLPLDTTASARLEQVVKPWDTDVYLRIRYAAVDFTLPVEVARALLADLGRLVDRAFPVPLGPEHVYAAELATDMGSPANADDDTCPYCLTEVGTEWWNEDDFGRNHWSHTFEAPDAGPDERACGARWSTPVRRPNNGVPITFVEPGRGGTWEVRCFFCRERTRGHLSEMAARWWADQHTADHEAEEAP